MAFFNDFFRFFLILEGFWQGFGRVWGWLFDDCSHFFPKLRFYWKVNKTLRGRMNFKGRLLKKHVKVTKKLIKNRCKFTIKKIYAKKRLEIWFWKVLASIWEGFGTLWAALWSLLGAFWRFFRLSKSYLVKALVQDGPQEAFWMDFGSLWKGFGTICSHGFGASGKARGLVFRTCSALVQVQSQFNIIGYTPLDSAALHACSL